jgi:Transposase DDE domain group 1
MRLAKHEIRQRIKSDLKIEFAPLKLTSHSGLELFKRYFRIIQLGSRIKKAFRAHDLRGDYEVVDVILVLIAMWLVGGDRLCHVKWIAEDPLVKRLCELSNLPSDRTLSRWLAQFTNDSLQALVALNSEIVFEKLKDLELGTITLDFDGTVLSAGDKVQWAFRGYNPHDRHAKSYFPLLCHVAQTGHFLQVKNRPGNIADGKSFTLGVIKACVEQVRENLPGVRIEVRMDSAFFQEPILRYLNRQNIRFAVKVPMWKWLKLKETINARERWYHAHEKLTWFKKAIPLDCWSMEVEMTFFRQKISDKPKKNHQLDLFTPDDGVYEFSVLCSNMSLRAENLFDFYNGRCAMEHDISELKGEFAFASIPTQSYQGNSAHQQISIMAHNLVRNFQIDTKQTVPRNPGYSRTNVLEFNSLKTLRLEWINVAGRIVNTDGRKTLKLNECEPREKLFNEISRALAQISTA